MVPISSLKLLHPLRRSSWIKSGIGRVSHHRYQSPRSRKNLTTATASSCCGLHNENKTTNGGTNLISPVRTTSNLMRGVPPHSRQQPARWFSSQQYFGRKMFGGFNFGTNEYASCFNGLPHPNPEDFRTAALDYLDNEFDAQKWYDDPICTIVNGVPLPHESEPVDTLDALGQVNGKQVFATGTQIETVIEDHLRNYHSQWTDLRDVVRQAEQDLLTSHGGKLIGNQCMDFKKQDGVTELEEMVMACVVERRLNDYLILEEKRQRVTVNRKPIYVHCVSNFSNFLDLSRKVLRSLELGVPVVILGRTNQVQQHSYRWTQLLIEQAVKQQGLDPGMITFLSCSLDDIKSILTNNQDCTGNLYMTGSRQLAAQITSIYPNTIASTGGPNTMLISTPKQDNPIEEDLNEMPEGPPQSKELTGGNENKKDIEKTGGNKGKQNDDEEEWFSPQMREAIYTSAAIESSGQCTALRHVIVPPHFTEEDVGGILSSVATSSEKIDSPVEALRQRKCDKIFPTAPSSSSDPKSSGYTHDEKSDTYWKMNDTLPVATEDSSGLPEYWRKVVVDYTKLETDPWDYTTLDKLAHWLNQTQPISLVVNGNMVDSYKNLRRLFDRTALAVYTVGGRNDEEIPTNPYPKLLTPALTCQARPQECEIFGEVPPRHSLHKYTKFPVYVPSSNPSYDTSYRLEYLQEQSDTGSAAWGKSSRALMDAIQNKAVRGYCCLLIEYLRNVDDQNPKKIFVTSTGRSVMWGLQRPPLQCISVLRCQTEQTTWDACAPMYMIFHVTSARDQIQISIPPGNTTMIQFCEQRNLPFVVESDDDFKQRVARDPFASSATAAEPTNDAEMNQKPIFQVEYVDKPMTSFFPMAGQFTSLYFPMGHIKSTAPRDEELSMRFGEVSKKWIKTLF